MFSSWLLPVLAAPFIGSFLGVVALRADRPRSIVFGRSACAACGSRLGVRDLAPLASWIVLRGRCRHCRRPISLFYPGIELAATGVAIWAAADAAGPALWPSCLLGWMLLALAAADFRFYLLPDFLTLPLIAAGLVVAWALDPDDMLSHVVGAAAGLTFIVVLRYIYWIMRKREGIGLGDAKLLAAAGAWVTLTGLPSVVLLAAVAALVFAVARQGWAGRLTAADRVPFGPFLCFGLWIVWLYGPLGIGV